jgi:multiple sugar transport system permease protein
MSTSISVAQTPSGSGGVRPRRRRSSFGDERMWRWITIAPALALMVGLALLPLANLLAMSVSDVSWANGRAHWSFAGMSHYLELPGDPLFRAGLINTSIFALVAVTGQMALGFLLAVLCSRVVRGQIVYRTLFILPILIPGIVIGAIWKLIYNYDFGLINQMLGTLGIEPIDWLGQPTLALISVIIVDIWHWTPFCFLLLLAAVQSLPQDVFEAAKVDGVTAWQEFRHVTLPMMWPTLVVTFAFRLVLAFKVFDEVYLLTGGGPGTATEVASFTIYGRFFTEDRVGPGSALAIAFICVVWLLLLLALAARRRSEAAA